MGTRWCSHHWEPRATLLFSGVHVSLAPRTHRTKMPLIRGACVSSSPSRRHPCQINTFFPSWKLMLSIKCASVLGRRAEWERMPSPQVFISYVTWGSQALPILQKNSSRVWVNEGEKKEVKAYQGCKAIYILTGSLKEHWMRDKGNETENDSIQHYDFMTLESRKKESFSVCGCHFPIFALISVNSWPLAMWLDR